MNGGWGGVVVALLNEFTEIFVYKVFAEKEMSFIL